MANNCCSKCFNTLWLSSPEVDDLRGELYLQFIWFTHFAVFSSAEGLNSREGDWEDSLALTTCSKKANNVFNFTQSSFAVQLPSSSSHLSTTLFGSLSTIRGLGIQELELKFQN